MPAATLHPLIDKLRCFADLSPADEAALRGTEIFIRRLKGREDVVREDDACDRINVMIEGFACGYKLLPNGRRQIVAYHLPGDICDLRRAAFGRMDHSVATIAPARVAVWSRHALWSVAEEHPRILRALWTAAQSEAAIAREWLFNLGQRAAGERIAHLLCELFCRLRAIGETEGNRCRLPMTQIDFADTLGLSVVHVNRTLQELRRLGLIDVARGVLTVYDPDGLCDMAGFSPTYLNLNGIGQEDTSLGLRRLAPRATSLLDIPATKFARG